MAFTLENGLIPSRNIIMQATAKGAKYNYLWYLVDEESSIIFKYLERPSDKMAHMRLTEFEADTKS